MESRLPPLAASAQRSGHGRRVAPVLRGAQVVSATIGRHRVPLPCGALFADGVRRPLLKPGRVRRRSETKTTQGGPISTDTRVNERIRVPEVRLIGPGGEQVGIVRLEDALRVAGEANLDLVEVAPNARPPVCKIMDYGKYKYETAQKARESRRNQQQTVVKEQKLRPKIDPHDYETKKGHVVRFLESGSKVKITIMFRGREQSRPELGFRLLQRLGADVADYGFVETSAKQDGRNMTMVLAPHRGAKTRAKAAQQAGSTGGSPAPDSEAADAGPPSQ